MAIVRSMDRSITTVVVDLGRGPMPIWVDSPVEDVLKVLQEGGAVGGDSGDGRVYVFKSVVKYCQSGRREPTSTAANRPSGLPL